MIKVWEKWRPNGWTSWGSNSGKGLCIEFLGLIVPLSTRGYNTLQYPSQLAVTIPYNTSLNWKLKQYLNSVVQSLRFLLLSVQDVLHSWSWYLHANYRIEWLLINLEEGFSPVKITAFQPHSAEIYRSCFALLISFISLVFFFFFSDAVCFHGYEDVIPPIHSLFVQDCMFSSTGTSSQEVSVAWEGQRVLFGGSLWGMWS